MIWTNRFHDYRVIFIQSMNSSHALPSLPSLNALRSFDALARTGSVTAAAQALSVTQGAVSHQISLLEEWFGKELVRRDGRGLLLTDLGRELAEETRGAFDSLVDACRNVSRRGGKEIDLAAPASFLSHWMIPRLEELESSHPKLRLRLRTEGCLDDLGSGRIDALVTCGSAPWPTGLRIAEIEQERIGPVCTKKWAKGAGSSAWLSTIPRLATDSRPEAWKEWTRSSGHPVPRGKPRLFDHLTPLLEAAYAGLGVAMVPELIARRQIEEGRLVAPCGFVDSGRQFALAYPDRLAEDPGMVNLAEWFASARRGPLHVPVPSTSRRG